MNGSLNFREACFAGLIAILVSMTGMSSAAPGAHGPGGEHLDAPVSSGAVQSRPRMEVATELYEMVAELGGGELSILLDRFETNEPVTKAEVEVESGGVKATAKFHADHGDYSVDDPAMMKLLAQPGEHTIVVLVKADGDSDLLNGTLVVASAQADDHDHEHERAYLTFGAVTLAFFIIAAWFWQRRRRRKATSAGDAS